MSDTTIISMNSYSLEHIDAIARFEREVNELESLAYNAGIEHLAKENGDRGVLCFRDDKLVGLLSWFTSDGSVARVDARVHPHYRRQGVFGAMLRHAAEEIAQLGIRSYSYRIPRDSAAGLAAAKSVGAVYQRSEYAMKLRTLALEPVLSESVVSLRPGRPEDFEFMVDCFSRAFGDSESWTRDYFAGTNEPSRTDYIAWMNGERIGMIRVNDLGGHTAVIHDFCILPGRQGQGLGVQVLLGTVELLSAHSYSLIRLSVVTNNARALGLYLKAGFEITAENLYYDSRLELH